LFEVAHFIPEKPMYEQGDSPHLLLKDVWPWWEVINTFPISWSVYCT